MSQVQAFGLRSGAVRIDAKGAVFFHGQSVKMTPQETAFLRTLVQAGGAVVRYGALYAACAQSDADPELLKVLAYKVRRKLRAIDAQHGIVTHVGTGYGYEGARLGAAPATLDLAPGASFHAQAMAWLDINTGAGVTAVSAHYFLREALRRANMQGAPIQNRAQWGEAAANVAAQRLAIG